MICLQKILLCCDSMEPHWVCAHTSLTVHLLWLAAIFAKLPSVLSPAFLPLLTHVSHWCHPSLSLMGRELFPHLNLLCFPSHSTIFTITGSALRTLCLFIVKDGFPVYYCQTISFNTQPCATCIFFFPNRNSLCCSLCLTGTCKLFIDLSCQLSLLSLHAVRSLALFTSCSFSLT